MTGRLSKLASLALALAVVSSMAMSGLIVSTAAATDGEDEGTFTVRQSEDCYRVSSIGDGSETVESFYDYTGQYDYSSAGTTEYQKNQVSNLFFHNGSEGYSLVFVHDEYSDDAPYGSTISFDITGLPLDGEWAVEDDDYENSDDVFDHSGTQSEIDWKWSPDRNDGAAFRGMRIEPDTNITIDPGFNEDADAWGDWVWSGDEDNKTEAWRVLDGAGDKVAELDMKTNVSVTNSPCDQTPPEASVTANKTTVGVGEPVGFDASNSTDNEEIIEYRWDFDDDGTIDENTSEPTTAHAYADTGEYNATVTAVDAAGNTDSANVTITVEDEDTEPPNAKLDAPSEAFVGENVTLDASNSTDNGTIDTYKWDFDGDGTIDENTTTATIDTSYGSTGDYDASVTVVDAAGNEDTANATITVTEQPDTQPPEAVLDAPSEAVVGETVELNASESSDDVGIVEYRWDFDGDGDIDENTSEATTTTSYSSADEYDVNVTVADAAGNTDTASATINVTASDDTEPPTAKLDAPSEALTGETVTLDASASDDNEGIVEYRWDFDGDGTIDRNTSSATTDTSYASADEYNVSVTVVDAGDNTDTANATITVTEDTEPPTAKLDAPSQTEVDQTITLNASDSTDNVGIVEYKWDFDGDGNTDQTTQSATVESSYTNAGTYDAMVTVRDAAGNEDMANATVNVTEATDDQPPTATLDAPSNALTGETITFDASNSTDNEGIDEYKWDFDGDGDIDQTTQSDTVDSSYASAGTYDATVTVRDAAGNEDTANATITVTEPDDDDDTEPPTAKLDAPSQTTVGTTITLDASNSSDNVGIVKYKWDFDGDGEIDQTTDSATVTTSYANTGDYDASVTVRDAAGNKDTATTTISVTDGADEEPPTATLDAPSTAKTDETITFDASASTDNEGIVEYKWDFDSDGDVDRTTTSAKTDWSYGSAGEYTATVTVHDAAGNADTASATIDVKADDSDDSDDPGQTDPPDDPDTQPPTARLDAPSEAIVGESITLDASDSADDSGIVEYKWDFDGDDDIDRTTGVPAVTKKYEQTGDFNPTVTVVDAAGNTDSASAHISVLTPDTEPPTARLDAPSEAIVGEQIKLDATASADARGIVEYRWDWDFDGDGDVDKRTSVPAVTHRYEHPGEFNPAVTVADAAGNTDTASAHITVRTPDTEPPTARLDVPSEAVVGEQITLNATASADDRGIVEYRWDWDFDGDGDIDKRTEVPAITHRYDHPGDYNPAVTVADAAGNTDTANRSITVSAPEPDPPADDDPTPPPNRGWNPPADDTSDDNSDDTSDDADQSDDSSDDSAQDTPDTPDQTPTSMPDLSVEPLQDTTETVEAGKPVSLTVTVNNNRNTSIVRGIVVATSGPGEAGITIQDSIQLNISAGGEQEVTATMTLDEPGEHEVYVGNQTFTVTVAEPTDDSSQTPDDAPSDTPDDTPEDSSEEPPAEDLSDTTTETPTDSQDETESPTETSETPSENGPGFGIFSVVLAMLLSFLALYRRR